MRVVLVWGVALVTLAVMLTAILGIPWLFTVAINKKVKQSWRMFVAAAIAGVFRPLIGDMHTAIPPHPAGNGDVAASLKYLWTAFAFVEPRVLGTWFLVATLIYFASDLIRRARETFPRSGGPAK